MTSKGSKNLGLYIHIPFCRTLCVYCAFPTYANKTSRIGDYIDSLINEITAKSKDFGEYQVDSIYFGGGTPSLLESDQLDKILAAVGANFKTAPGCEIGLEANPESLSSEKIGRYREMGITRLSVGIQSLKDRTLWKIARPHTAINALQTLETLNNAAWKNFGCDLIIGLPYQTLAGFKKDLQTVMRYQPAHLSTYFLSYDTPKIDTFIQDIPGEDEQIAMYEYADRYLNQLGFNHYEVSNYARPGFECRHNLKYWNREEYLGLGLGAHSFIGNEVMENQDNFEKYLADPPSPQEQFKLEGDLAAADYTMLALRKSTGINLNRYSTNFGDQKTSELLKKAAPYLKTKHLSLSKDRLVPTLKGWLILDKITRDLI